MRQGYTLLEMMLACVILAIITSIAIPPALDLRDRMSVDEAARAITAAYRHARMSAILRNRATVLSVNGNELVLRSHDDATPIWRARGPNHDGVAFSGPEREAMFAPVGFSIGVSNATYILTRGRARRSVIISRLGRVRIAYE